MKKLVIFGAGNYGRKAYQKLKNKGVVFFIDNNTELCGKRLYGIEILDLYSYKKIAEGYNLVIGLSENREKELMEQLFRNQIYDFILYSEIDYYLEGKILLDVKLKEKHMMMLFDYYRENINILEKKNKFLLDNVDIHNLKPARGYARKNQLKMLEFSNDIFVNLKDNIAPFLIAGNLLGYIRNNGFIPWDDDVDFGMMRDSYNYFINYCKHNYKVFICDVDYHKRYAEQKYVDLLLRKYPNEVILVIFPNQLQINYGKTLYDRKVFDVFCFDSFQSNYDFKEYMKEINDIKSIFQNTFSSLKIIKYIDGKINGLKDKYDENGNNIYFSLDNMISTMSNNDTWIERKNIFPLRMINYEGYRVNVPNHAEEYIEYEYKKYDEFPDDYGIGTHDYIRDVYSELYTTVEFYIVDSFEIYHFIPLYHVLRQNGVYAIFVIEDEKINTSGKWFDYKTAKNILEENELEFSEYSNANTDIVFTTQGIEVLTKYPQSIKISLSYGPAFNNDDFLISPKSTIGFDYKFVNGEFQKDILSEKNYINKENIINVGYPKHYGYKYSIENRNQVVKELNINTEKRILVYLPTWDHDPSVEAYYDEIMKLKEQYFVVTKPHHCTFRLESQAERLKKIYELSDVVLDGNYDFEKAVSIADVLLCDATSGASTESRVLNPEARLVLLSTRNDIKEYFYSEIEDFADAVVNNPNDLLGVMDGLDNRQKDWKYVIDMDKNEEDLWHVIKTIIIDNHLNKL